MDGIISLNSRVLVYSEILFFTFFIFIRIPEHRKRFHINYYEDEEKSSEHIIRNIDK